MTTRPSLAGLAASYYVGLTRALGRQDLPTREDELLAWFLAQSVLLWNRECTIEGDTFGQYLQRSGVRLPAALLRHRELAAAAVYAWPLLAAWLVRASQPGGRARWQDALRRPDLHAAFPGMRFSDAVLRQRRPDMFVAIFNAWHYAETRSVSYAIEEKRTFARCAREAHLPCVPEITLAEARSMPGPFIVKDPAKDMGHGVTRVERSEDLAAIAGVERLLIQPVLANHSALLEILPPQAPLCTLRLTTTWERDQAIAHIAYFRIGGSGDHVDNVSRGGLFVEVDLATGILREGLTHAMLHGREPMAGVRRAPAASADLVGMRLPHFEEAKALVVRAHAALCPDLLSIGWDVALGPEGPVLVEANVFAGSFEVAELHDSFGLTTREMLRRFDTLRSRRG